MSPYIFMILVLALVSFKPTTSLSATKLTIGHSTINPRIAPLYGSPRRRATSKSMGSTQLSFLSAIHL